MYQDDRIPSDVLTSGDAVALNKWLSLFVIEVRKQDSNKHPSKTIDLLLTGLKHHMKEINPSTPNFLNEEDDRFKGLHGTRDTIACQLREQGIGASVKHVEVTTHEEEALLWDQGILGVSTPRSLFYAVFFMNGKVLCLRGGRKHKALKISRFKFGFEDDREFIKYTVNGSKNRSGSCKDKSGNKIVKHFADSSLGERCYVFLIKTYLSKFPAKVKESENADFYWKPKDLVPTDEPAFWFIMKHCGRNFLATVVKTVCVKNPESRARQTTTFVLQELLGCLQQMYWRSKYKSIQVIVALLLFVCMNAHLASSR